MLGWVGGHRCDLTRVESSSLNGEKAKPKTEKHCKEKATIKKGKYILFDTGRDIFHFSNLSFEILTGSLSYKTGTTTTYCRKA